MKLNPSRQRNATLATRAEPMRRTQRAIIEYAVACRVHAPAVVSFFQEEKVPLVEKSHLLEQLAADEEDGTAHGLDLSQ